MIYTRRNVTLEIIGWIGVALILLGYALLSLGVIDANNILYHVLFLIGSTGLAVISYVDRAPQPMVLNIIFMILAIFAISRIALFA